MYLSLSKSRLKLGFQYGYEIEVIEQKPLKLIFISRIKSSIGSYESHCVIISDICSSRISTPSQYRQSQHFGRLYQLPNINKFVLLVSCMPINSYGNGGNLGIVYQVNCIT